MNLRPNTPAARVLATLVGPEKGVDPSWHRLHFCAKMGDVESLSTEDANEICDRAGLARGTDLIATLRSDALPAMPRKTWSELSDAEKRDLVDDGVAAHAEVGRRVSRSEVADWFSRTWV